MGDCWRGLSPYKTDGAPGVTRTPGPQFRNSLLPSPNLLQLLDSSKDHSDWPRLDAPHQDAETAPTPDALIAIDSPRKESLMPPGKPTTANTTLPAQDEPTTDLLDETRDQLVDEAGAVIDDEAAAPRLEEA